MPNNFTYNTPTKVVFGRDTELRVGELIKEQQCSKALIHYGSASAEKSGLIARIARTLEEAGIGYALLGGVKANPRLSLVYSGIELCKKEGIDFILAVGGGSVIDSSKAISYGVANEGDVWDYYNYTRQAEKCLPVGAVLTIAAAGSEMSNSSVITNEDGGSSAAIKTKSAVRNSQSCTRPWPCRCRPISPRAAASTS
jgi:alcohol dehydrogenase YqhD (iron-dependent ADH family)